MALALLLVSTEPLEAQRSRAVRPAEPPPAVWLAAHAIPLASVEPRDDESDLAPLLPLFTGARIIALGDATHGTHEFYSVKLRLLPWLVRNAGVRTIALEAPYAEFQRISEYVRTGVGDPSAMLESSDYFFWDTDEVLGVIEWARRWNASGKTPVDVVGIDAFHPHPTTERVLAYVAHADAAAVGDIASRYECLMQYAPASYRTQPAEFRSSCRDSIATVRPLLASRRAEYLRRTTVEEFDETLYATRLVEQGEVALSSYEYRDVAMAENLAALAARKSGAIAVWGHNEHFGKTPHTLYRSSGTRNAGTILKEQFGDRYVAVGSIALQGLFNAMEFSHGVGSIGVYAMTTPTPDDYALVLREAGVAAMIVPLRAPLPNSLALPKRIRIAGSTATRAQTMVSLTQDLDERFDAVLYVETSTPTRLRHWPQLR